MTSADTVTVKVELISWVNQFAGGSGTGTMELDVQVPPGESVRGVLKQASQAHPKLREALWDADNRDEIGPHIEVIVNDEILGGTYTLDSPMGEKDCITLAGQYIGG